MTKTWNERLINVAVAFFIAMLCFCLALRISFNYTEKYYEKSNKNQDVFIQKLDILIEKVDKLNEK